MSLLDELKKYSAQVEERRNKELSAPKRTNWDGAYYIIFMRAIKEKLFDEVNRHPNKETIEISFGYSEIYSGEYRRVVLSIPLGVGDYVYGPYDSLKTALEEEGLSCYRRKKRIYIVAYNIKDYSFTRKR